MSTRWLTVLAVFLGLAACTPSEFAEPPEVVLVSMVPVDVSLMEQRLAVTLRVRNPNNAPMSVDGLRFAIDVNGKTFAKGTSDKAVTVPRLGEAELAGTAHVSTTDLMRQVLGTSTLSGLAYRMSGTLFLAGTGGRSVGFESDGDFDFASALGGAGKRN
ncbi:secreted protein [Paramagnetospirillum caucaseum]|uniref:Secreted protein n=1 Tax=Paramagnetospirillum caucaseum TaxID=1244869 RepID=M2ZBI8_9PROT|nr:LEA type 2 family protein [Paramagnetospirillum caucaseum]EME71800.1 secreted protein [Paramagnetospirillum caucaseum]